MALVKVEQAQFEQLLLSLKGIQAAVIQIARSLATEDEQATVDELTNQLKSSTDALQQAVESNQPQP